MHRMLVPIRDCYVNSSRPHQNYGRYRKLKAGSAGAGHYRSFLQFSLDWLPVTAAIMSSKLRLFVIENDFPSTPKLINLHRVLNYWNGLTLTYDNSPLIGSAVDASQIIMAEIGVFVEWDVTDLVKGWFDGSIVNAGVAALSAEESGLNLLEFSSGQAPDSSNWPRLEVNFEVPSAIVTVIPEPIFTEDEETIITSDSDLYTASRDVSLQTMVTFFVENLGANPAAVQLQLSPDLITWYNEDSEVILNPGQVRAFVPTRFLKYARIKYRSANAGSPTSLRNWYQAQIES